MVSAWVGVRAGMRLGVKVEAKGHRSLPRHGQGQQPQIVLDRVLLTHAPGMVLVMGMVVRLRIRVSGLDKWLVYWLGQR